MSLTAPALIMPYENNLLKEEESKESRSTFGD